MSSARVADEVVVPVVDDDDVFVCPAALQQQGLWFLDRLHPGTATYNIVSAFMLEGPVEWAVVQRCVDALVERHEALRTTFARQDDQLVQIIHPSLSTPIRMASITGGVDAEAEALRLAEAEAATAFDLATGPLIRFTSIAIAPGRSLFVMVMHHAISDGWSQTILLDEIGRLYRARAAGEADPLEPVAIQFADYCVWQDKRLTPDLVQGQLDFWKSALAGVPDLLDLPSDHVRPAVPSGRGDTVWLTVDRATTDAVRQLCRSEGATTFMLFVTALGALLARHSGQHEVAIGTPITGRSRPELETAVGFFANTVVVRTSFDDDPTFRAALGRTRATALRAYQNSDAPFQLVADTLRPGRGDSHNPLFQAMCIVLPVPDAPLSLPGVDVRPMQVSTGTAKFDLLVDCMERSDSMHVAFEYSTDLFDRSTAERLAARFLNLLRTVTTAPDAPLSGLSMALPDEPALLASWNDTARPLPAHDTVVALVNAAADRTPDAVAIVAGSTHITYADLMRRVRQLGAHLRAVGVLPGGLVGVCLDRSEDMVVALLAILESRAAYLPLDPAFPPGRLAFMVEDSATAFVVTNAALESVVPGSFTRIRLDSDRDAIQAAALTAPGEPPRGFERAYVLYTSGSTGQPKGVQIPHRALANFLLSMQRTPGLSARDRLLAVTTLSFDIAGLELYLPLISGGTVVIATRDDAVDPIALAALLERHDITVLQATPATWRLLLESGWKGKSNLRVFCGGEAMTRDLADRLVDSVEEVWNLYGPTETTIWSTVDRIEHRGAAITIGRPIDNTQVYVVDAALRPTPHGVIGELVIGGDGLALGYLNRDDLTADRFVPDAFAPGPGRRLYRTGDRARFRPDGRLECLGRMDHQVKVRGYRIELGEIEAVLNGDDDVRQAVVVAREDPGHETRLVAYVVAAADRSDDVLIPRLKERLGKHVPAYMVPSAFVTMAALPLTPNGKVDRKALPAPTLTPVRAAGEAAPPSTRTEEAIAGIWRDVLALSDIGVDDNFFQAGGHSLAALRVFMRIETELGVSLPLSTLFAAPTIRALAGLIDTTTMPGAASQWPSVVVINDVPGPAIVGIHSLSGDVLEYRLIAQHVSPTQRVIGLQAPLGSDVDVDATFGTIEATAERYVKELRAVQPDGPYYLCGWSSGGAVALEMAQLLQRGGADVAMLAVIDSAPYNVGGPLRPAPVRAWKLLTNVPRWMRDDLLATPVPAMISRVRHRFKAAVRQASGAASAEPTVRDMVDFPSRPARWEHFAERHYQAFRRYVPAPYAGRVSLLKARTQPLTWINDAERHWRHLAQAVDVYPVPGTHFSIVREPNVQVLATAIETAVRRSRQRSAR